LLLLACAAVAGCTAPSNPNAEAPIFSFPVGTIDHTAATFAFDLTARYEYFRTNLSAAVQDNVTYNATAPNGTAYVGSIRSTWPFVPELRVSNPAEGKWSITVGATQIVRGTLQLMVPAADVSGATR
jgi:hypothetical protein